MRLHGGLTVLEVHFFFVMVLHVCVQGFRPANETGLFKMAFVRVLGINTGLELRTRNKKSFSQKLVSGKKKPDGLRILDEIM